MEEARNLIYSLQSTGAALIQSLSSRPLHLDAMNHYLSRLCLDISTLSIIHVAGTKGKGSTCAFTESILRNMGCKTGLFIFFFLIYQIHSANHTKK